MHTHTRSLGYIDKEQTNKSLPHYQATLHKRSIRQSISINMMTSRSIQRTLVARVEYYNALCGINAHLVRPPQC